MTEKRFEIDVFGDFRDEENKLWGVEAICDLLNTKIDENEQLKRDKECTIQVLKEHCNHAQNQKVKNLDHVYVARAYDIIRYNMCDLVIKLENGGFFE